MIIKKRANKKQFLKRKNPYFRINQDIVNTEVRLVGEGINPGIYTRNKALEIATERGLDLIEISNQGDYPICKIMEFSKFQYERKKIQKVKERANKIELKEVRIAPNIAEHDFDFKKRHAVAFLDKGCSVRIQVFFRRRRDFYIYRELAEKQLQRLVQTLEEHGGKKKHDIKLLGRQMFTIIDPIKRKH